MNRVENLEETCIFTSIQYQKHLHVTIGRKEGKLMQRFFHLNGLGSEDQNRKDSENVDRVLYGLENVERVSFLHLTKLV